MTAAERADLGLFRLVRSAARPPLSDAVGRFSRLGEHAALWLALGAVSLGVHYPSDVAGGALLGLALGGAAR